MIYRGRWIWYKNDQWLITFSEHDKLGDEATWEINKLEPGFVKSQALSVINHGVDTWPICLAYGSPHYTNWLDEAGRLCEHTRANLEDVEYLPRYLFLTSANLTCCDHSEEVPWPCDTQVFFVRIALHWTQLRTEHLSTPLMLRILFSHCSRQVVAHKYQHDDHAAVDLMYAAAGFLCIPQGSFLYFCQDHRVDPRTLSAHPSSLLHPGSSTCEFLRCGIIDR